MTTAKHTHGPWEIDGNAQTVRAGLGVSVAFCGESGIYTRTGSQSIGVMEARANARLIAAAPDLLGALRSMLTAYETVHGIGDLEMQPAIFFARKCIAAATGETA